MRGNGDAGSSTLRQLRLDDRRGAAGADVLGPTRSGRWFVMALAFVLGAFAVALFVAFRQWKSRHVELAAYGARHVATALSPLADKVPPGLEPAAWARVVEQARAVLVGLTASGTMDLDQMRRLRGQIQEMVLSARPETAAPALASLWNDLERRAGPGLTRAPRFELAGALGALAKIEAEGVAPEHWALLIVQTRAMLVALGNPRPLPMDVRRALRQRIEERLARATPKTAAADLAEVWDLVADVRPIPDGFAPTGFAARNGERP